MGALDFATGELSGGGNSGTERVAVVRIAGHKRNRHYWRLFGMGDLILSQWPAKASSRRAAAKDLTIPPTEIEKSTLAAKTNEAGKRENLADLGSWSEPRRLGAGCVSRVGRRRDPQQ